jgi:hypothetical protein
VHSRLGWRRPALVALAVLAGVVQIPSLVSDQRLRASESLALVSADDRALELAGDAIEAEPWAATPYASRALIDLAAGDPEASVADATEAARREPTNWRHRLMLLRAQVAAKDTPGALATLEDLERLRPAMASDVRLIRADLLSPGEGELPADDGIGDGETLQPGD